jgi:hypothetical protein
MRNWPIDEIGLLDKSIFFSEPKWAIQMSIKISTFIVLAAALFTTSAEAWVRRPIAPGPTVVAPGVRAPIARGPVVVAPRAAPVVVAPVRRAPVVIVR